MPHAIYDTENEHGRGRVVSWASILEDNTREQAERTSRSPIVKGHVALMPDAHLGSGATVGSVIMTEGGIIPAAVGVDIGCGIIAVKTNVKRSDISKAGEHELMALLRGGIPNGVGQNHTAPTERAVAFFQREGAAPGIDTESMYDRALAQFGTLGSGNHFAEYSIDSEGFVWALVHSGSRGVGLALATSHVKKAREVCPVMPEDRDLAFLVEGTREFDAYIADMTWAQSYAAGSRAAMAQVTVDALKSLLLADINVERVVNCHHNYAEPQGNGLWLTRKGAIDATLGRLGVVPGSMGTDTYIVSGKGNVESYASAPHGAGRLFSRGNAYRTLSVDDLRASMEGKTWGDRDADALLDEAPAAYKPIEVVMADSADLVRPTVRLSAFLNFKAADSRRQRKKVSE